MNTAVTQEERDRVTRPAHPEAAPSSSHGDRHRNPRNVNNWMDKGKGKGKFKGKSDSEQAHERERWRRWGQDNQGEYETPLREVPKLARRCFPWADTVAECTWHQCEAEEKTSSADAEELDECTCYHMQDSFGCNGSAARLFGPNASKVQALLQQGIFWSWVGDRLGRNFSEDATAVQRSFLELEVWLTGGLQLDAGLHSEVGGAVWDSACLQVLCYCGGLQCRSTWGSLLGTLATGNLNITAPSSAAEPSGAASSNSSQQGTVDLVVTWGIQVSSEPLSADLGRGIEFSSQLRLEDESRELLAFCEGTDPELIILRRRCWPIEFKRWLTDRGSYYPVPSELFYPFLRSFFQDRREGCEELGKKLRELLRPSQNPKPISKPSTSLRKESRKLGPGISSGPHAHRSTSVGAGPER
eukprot:s2627_g7.t1